MEQIEKRLHEHFASLDQVEETQVSASSVGPPVLADSRAAQSDEAFARVISVDPNSPADRAGLMAGDRIRTFGWINNTNHDNLRKVAECVQGNEGVCLLIQYSRTWPADESTEFSSRNSVESGWRSSAPRAWPASHPNSRLGGSWHVGLSYRTVVAHHARQYTRSHHSQVTLCIQESQGVLRVDNGLLCWRLGLAPVT